jgi:hypothetical protein
MRAPSEMNQCQGMKPDKFQPKPESLGPSRTLAGDSKKRDQIAPLHVPHALHDPRNTAALNWTTGAK